MRFVWIGIVSWYVCVCLKATYTQLTLFLVPPSRLLFRRAFFLAPLLLLFRKAIRDLKAKRDASAAIASGAKLKKKESDETAAAMAVILGTNAMTGFRVARLEDILTGWPVNHGLHPPPRHEGDNAVGTTEGTTVGTTVGRAVAATAALPDQATKKREAKSRFIALTGVPGHGVSVEDVARCCTAAMGPIISCERMSPAGAASLTFTDGGGGFGSNGSNESNGSSVNATATYCVGFWSHPYATRVIQAKEACGQSITRLLNSLDSEGGGGSGDRGGDRAAAQAVVVVWACPSQDLPAMFDLEKVLAGASTGLGGGAGVKKMAAAVEKEDSQDKVDSLIDRIESQLLEMGLPQEIECQLLEMGMPQQLIERKMEDLESADEYEMQQILEEGQETLAAMRDDPEIMDEMQQEWQQECEEQFGDDYGEDEGYNSGLDYMEAPQQQLHNPDGW